MALTKEEVLARRQTIGASDVAIILGLSRHKTPLELYKEKQSNKPPVASPDDKYSEWGHINEANIVRAFCEKAGEYSSLTWLQVQRARAGGGDVVYYPEGVHPDIRWATCTPDAWIPGCNWGVEAKNRGFTEKDKWGPSGSTEIPPDVEAQVRWSMFVTAAEKWGVGVLIGGNDFRYYWIERDEEWEAWALPIVEAFRNGVVLDETAWEPAGTATTGGKREAIEFEHSLMGQFLRERAALEEAKVRVHETDEALRHAIGEDLSISSSGYSATLSPVKGRSSTDWEEVAKRLYADAARHSAKAEEDFSAAVKACTKTSKPYRRLTVKETTVKEKI